MGSVSLKIGDGTARFRATTIYSTILNAIMLFSLLLTNLLALYTFSFPANQTPSLSTAHHQKNFSLISHEVSLILSEINSSQHKLAQMQKELIGFETLDLSVPGLPSELKLYMEAQPLPLGKDSRMGITEMVSAVGHACVNSIDLLSLYMNYKPGHQCPDDWDLAQKLMLRGCEPLPRRRCFSRSIPKLGLFPSLKSLWKMVPESSISWSRFACKNFDCLKKTLKDCPNCFDLNAEKKMWADAKDRFEFPIDEVIALGKGSLKLGLDLGSGSGGFAAKMAEKDVTVLTSSLNLGAPFCEFMAARGLFPLYLVPGQRLPFFDYTFDLIHVVREIAQGRSNSMEKVEFVLFDIDRVLRPGGFIWLEKLVLKEEMQKKYVGLIEKFGYKKVKWVVGAKGPQQVYYLSAVLQKPVRYK